MAPAQQKQHHCIAMGTRPVIEAREMAGATRARGNRAMGAVEQRPEQRIPRIEILQVELELAEIEVKAENPWTCCDAIVVSPSLVGILGSYIGIEQDQTIMIDLEGLDCLVEAEKLRAHEFRSR